MPDRLLALFGFLVLCGFLGVLLWEVPRLDLTILVAVTVALAGYDLFFYHGRDDRG
ncbi:MULTISPECIES: hypothetical protein [Pseudorhizobium]|jgi:hypothetical protein|uniref:hypothetical protein n=1 Tax=Pseudorhizobium TaxID=1903858 RepID=UPI000A60589F|nr:MULTISPECIES: hypothetical protein [Pseudorhizobium]MBU1313519.1 hypothetical protein [Alphaproteobacteria bacterium]MDY6962840.1 hypothetical protein [Pseudomonadota bacterium]MBU1549684.1 hypothetical protein [Alphaproteobacteria bacterium]MBU2335454.1 hypothetical protein [Alphaproteobacteria bacterium]MBU2389741.1 hypothetical protein [Alphaproteobacteria bacterium]|tara:strand:- start:814 stop:981 length:168 start_codon:yes stop_codon:yes gene_type:complete